MQLQVPVPEVHEDERLLVKHLEYPGFYRVVARYGYIDQVDQGPAFVKRLLQQLELEQRIIIAAQTKVPMSLQIRLALLLPYSASVKGSRTRSWDIPFAAAAAHQQAFMKSSRLSLS